MFNAHQPRTRSELVAGVRMPRGALVRSLDHLHRADVLIRLSLAAIAALLMWGVTLAWTPPLGYRAGHLPQRDVVARARFSVVDPIATQSLRQRARSEAQCYYENDRAKLIQLRTALKESVFQLISVESFEALKARDASVWQEFSQSLGEANRLDEEMLFGEFRAALREDRELARFERAVQGAFSKLEEEGLLVSLEHDLEEGSQIAIMVHTKDQPNEARRVEVRDVRMAEAQTRLKPNLRREFETIGFEPQYLDTLTELVHSWLMNKKLPVTLSLNRAATRRAQQEAADRVEPETIDYEPGDLLAVAATPLDKERLDLIRLEHLAVVRQMSLWENLAHSLADLGMYLALFILCGTYIHKHQPRLFEDLRQYVTLLAVVVLTVLLSVLAANDQWQAELVPLGLFGMTVGIAYRRELALMLAVAVSLVVSLSCGFSLAEFVIQVSASASAILLLGKIRSRTKLIYVGLAAAVVACLTTLGVGVLTSQPFGWSAETTLPFAQLHSFTGSFSTRLLFGAVWFGFTTFLAGVIMTGLLPFVERLFDVQTDMTLLELGDAAHPLLQELVRRAPGTYNHSITVASLGEAAAEAIGANGLLVRVGAYFHDIGKMLKPDYFIENQLQGSNRHASLLPAMSTLVIIAHVKDGADLARQHGLPQSVIDFIEQHHGTTLVEYFYREAARKSEGEPGARSVEEHSFRYPGPKPQNKETGILMLADAAESICRSLVEPGPARIEHVIHELVMKRLLDGQFDESTLTLNELHMIEDSLVKSLIAVYHGRVKYPDQQLA